MRLGLAVRSGVVVVFAGAMAVGGAVEGDDGPTQTPGKARQFDFWLGEWEVNNRELTAQGTWQDVDKARVRISPLFDRRLVIEQWHGVKPENTVVGFSARCFDPVLERWVLLLNWPGGTASSFWTLEGQFRHGRGEFFSGQGNSLTRYSFSDTLPQSVRWDASYTKDAGQTWNTNWIMEFSRTAPAAVRTVDRLFGDADADRTCPFDEARQFDFLHGAWSLSLESLDGEDVTAEHEGTLRVQSIIEGWMNIELYDDTTAGRQWFIVRGWIPQTQRWESWRIDDSDFRFQAFAGSLKDGEGFFTSFGPVEEMPRRRIQWTECSDDFFEWEESTLRGEQWVPTLRCMGARE